MPPDILTITFGLASFNPKKYLMHTMEKNIDKLGYTLYQWTSMGMKIFHKHICHFTHHGGYVETERGTIATSTNKQNVYDTH